MQHQMGGTTLFALSIVGGVGPAHGGKSKPAWVQRASVLAAALGFFTLCLVGRAVAQQGHDFTICEGDFALCAASTCQPTGGSITVNVIGGGTATFPEYKCTCPIFDGPSIADLNGGNMHGSCTPPHDQIWSPINLGCKFRRRSRTGRVCRVRAPHHRKFAGRTSSRATSWSIALASPANLPGKSGRASCNLSLSARRIVEGKAVEQHTAFATQAGQGNTEICCDHPVSGPLPTPQ